MSVFIIAFSFLGFAQGAGSCTKVCVSIWLMRVIAFFLEVCFQVISTVSGDTSLLTFPGIVSHNTQDAVFQYDARVHPYSSREGNSGLLPKSLEYR